VKPLHRARLPGYRITIWPNRVQVEQGVLPWKKETSIPFKNMASVEIKPPFKHLVRRTNDGKVYEYHISRQEAVRDAILNAT
jgi:hypothetical protein